VSAPPAAADIAGFIFEEARLLDSARWEDWLGLFAPEGRYRVPLPGGAPPAETAGSGAADDEPLGQSIADEDLLLLRIRVARLRHPRAYSLQPQVSCQHVLQQPHVERIDRAGNTFTAYTPFMYAECKGDEQAILFGAVRHRLRLHEGALRIVLKRVDLLNAAAPLPAIYLFI